MKSLWMIEQVRESDYCLMPNELFFRYLMARTSYKNQSLIELCITTYMASTGNIGF
jgi:hypothetical protein